MSELLNNRYQVVSVLAEGAFGKTFLAEDVHMPSRRRCVVKQLKPIIEPAQYDLVKERFKREAAILEHLGELTNRVPKLYAYFVVDDLFYLVQEWIEGKTLGQVSFFQENSNESIVKELILNLLIVLDSIHAQNIIHRDIKPDNIIVRQRDGKPCLIDFGIVKEVLQVDAVGNPTSSIIAGTPAFMAPEQAAGRPVFASDLYSLGMTAIYLLTGKSPGDMIDRLTGGVQWRQFARNISPEFANILDKVTEPNFRDRYKTATEMKEALRSLSARPSDHPLKADRSSDSSHLSTLLNQPPGEPPVSNQALKVIPLGTHNQKEDSPSTNQISAPQRIIRSAKTRGGLEQRSMSRKTTKKRGENLRSKRKFSMRVIAGAALAVAVSATLLIIASMRSGSEDQSSVPGASQPIAASDGRARQVAYEVVNSYPHDPTSFTQGLLWHDGGLYESTGQYGQSKLRRLEFPSGKVLKESRLSPELFGEGLALTDGRLIQLTWKSHRGFVYELSTFRLLQEFSYDTEGWGLTYDGKNLILSDGSSDLFYLDPQTFKPVRKLAVRMNGQPIRELNELEFIDGEIWANVWQTDLILRIDPSTGQVTSFLDLKGILAPSDKTGMEDVLNGIAYDSERKRIFVTGKLWPRIFEIRLKQ